MTITLYILIGVVIIALILFFIVPYFVYYYSSWQMEAWLHTFRKLNKKVKHEEERK